MAITTVSGHVARALDFYNRDDIFFAFGKQTPWENEDMPPAPEITMTDIEDILGFKQVENKFMVVPDEEGMLIYRDSRWTIIGANEAFEKSSRWVYIDVYLRYDELPLGEYRQIGVYSRLQKNDDIPSGQMALLPTEVKHNGVLEVVDNRKRAIRQSDQKEQLSIIIEF